MPYLQRNLYYVRVSPHAVLQTILYVDPSNLRWLNSGLYSDNDDEIDLTAEQEGNKNDEGERERTGDRVWARALSHLRERVMPKLRRESAENGLLASNHATSRGKVDTHIDVDFQMAYFFRQTTGRHAVLLKNKELTFPAKVEMPPPMLPASAMRGNNDRLRPSRLAERHANHSGEGDILAESRAIAEGEEAEDNGQSHYRKRQRSPGLFAVKDEISIDDLELIPEEEVVDEDIANETIDLDQVQTDQKPRVRVTYSGFQIFGKSLVIVIEPTKRTKRLRAPLFQARKRTEIHQLSAMPISEEERAASVRPSAAPQRADSRSQSFTPQLFRTARGASIASSFDGDELGMGEERADSRRMPSRSKEAPLFRGTPSEWDPTPTPTPAPDAGTSDRTDVEADDDPDESAEGLLNTQSVTLATQMMEADVSSNRVNDLDDDYL